LGKIAVLSPTLASQIAAGEVVDRPASALKELLENSLDAGATRCDVRIEGGGVTLLSVRDDGVGMSPEDAALCVERHATSKLQSLDDLMRVRSFGFRGEALPSIASVAKLTVRTRSADALAGTELEVQAGVLQPTKEVAMPAGTEVVVADLFYNVPARRKFLRSSATEAGHVADVVENAALACPDVSFTLERDGRRAREYLRAPGRKERVFGCFPGEELAECVGERGPLLFEAYLGRPERAKSGASGLKLFCNNRPIRDRVLLMTIAQAFGSVLERGRYPRGVVYLDLPPELVDVNVHPQKAEVRFADARAVADSVYQLASVALSRAFSLPGEVPKALAVPTGLAPAVSQARSGPALPRGRAAWSPGGASSQLRLHDVVASTSEPISEQTRNKREIPEGHSRSEPGAAETRVHDGEPTRATSSEGPARSERSASVVWSRLRFLAQVRATYLVCEGDDALYIIDQHAAAERVMFHRLREQYQAAGMTSQSLLFPLVLDVHPQQAEVIESKQAEIKRFGFEVRVRGDQQVSLHAVPKLLQRASPERLWFDLLGELARSGRAFSDAVDGVLSTMACHGSVRSGDKLAPKEASALLLELDKVDFSGHCPHGRPIVAATSWNELERRVGRR
jgi:DNA mismatch repair protein MutL